MATSNLGGPPPAPATSILVSGYSSFLDYLTGQGHIDLTTATGVIQVPNLSGSTYTILLSYLEAHAFIYFDAGQNRFYGKN